MKQGNIAPTPVFLKQPNRNLTCRAGTFNVRSLKSNLKKKTLVEDFESYRLDILGLTETWITGTGVESLDSGHVLYRSGGSSSRAGVAILVNKRISNNVHSFKFISDRIISVRILLNSRPDGNAVQVICCYAPTLQRSTNNPAEARTFYSSLRNAVKSVAKRDEVWILGDLNAKVGSAAPGTHGPVGCFSKHLHSNANGERLIEFCEDNDLILCNTQFKHQMKHRSTWFSDGLTHPDGKPVRNMIDFVMMRRSKSVKLVNARSYGGFTTRSDHHPVIAEFALSFWRCHSPGKSNELCFVKYQLPTDPDSTRKYRDTLSENLPDVIIPEITTSGIDAVWTKFVSVIHSSAEESFGKLPPRQRKVKSTNPLVKQLSDQQKQLHIRINSENDPTIRRQLSRERNIVLHHIRSILKREGDAFWQELAESADAQRPDARSYFGAIRQLRSMRSGQSATPVRLADADENIRMNVNWNLNKFNEYFSSVFHDERLPNDLRGNIPAGNEDTFSTAEVTAAIKRQRITGAVGCDGISASMLKAGGDLVAGWLTAFFNAIQRLEHCPEDLRCGLVVPIYKSGKPHGVPKSYRPVMLLSVVRKVLTSIITTRMSPYVNDHVRESQAGFRSGRSTADGVFLAKTMCERSTLGNWSYSAAFLDFSGAFDTLIRQTALERIADSGAATGTIAALISNTTARVKLSGQLSTPIETNIGVVQGDPLSPAMFIIYAENTMRKLDLIYPPTSLPCHDSQYADDTTLHATRRQTVEDLVPKCEPIFAEDNLKLNVQKTQFITSTKSDSTWKSTKLLGSLLGSEEDIAARISAANRAFASISWQRHSLSSRLNMFQTLILPVLLYNCGLWTLTKLSGEKLDAWHRQKLRHIINVHHPHHITNAELYRQTDQVPITSTCRKRRLLWLGHVIREGADAASYKALLLALNTDDIKRPRGRPPKRWVDNVKADLQPANLTIQECFNLASDKQQWLGIIDRCMTLI